MRQPEPGPLGTVRWELSGYCSLNPDQLWRGLQSRGLDVITATRGEFTAVFENAEGCSILTSPYGVCQHYYALVDGGFYHSDTVLGVVRQSGLPWSWNWRALGDLLQYGHTIGLDTLHPAIHRVPAASLLRFVDGRLSISTLPWRDLHRIGHQAPSSALREFNEELAWLTGLDPGPPMVSLSSGYDSRVILAALLAAGRRPRLLTMGFDTSTDVIIARRISNDLGLEHEVVELAAEDYLDHAGRIAEITNGTKLANHWHTAIYPRKAGIAPNQPLLVGTNGEFARSFYLQTIPLASAIGRLGAPALIALWLGKQTDHFQDSERARLHSSLADEFTRTKRIRRALRMTQLCHFQFQNGLDRFYLEQRVRHFIGNGVRLYQETSAWRSPFVARGWVEAIWSMDRRWKLQSRWHRFAVLSTCPQLLTYPTTGQVRPVIGYAKYSDWFRARTFVDFVMDRASALRELMDRSLVASVMEDHVRAGTRTNAVAFLITMAAWMTSVREMTR